MLVRQIGLFTRSEVLDHRLEITHIGLNFSDWILVQVVLHYRTVVETDQDGAYGAQNGRYGVETAKSYVASFVAHPVSNMLVELFDLQSLIG